MEKMALNESELAQRWGISIKTLQRWRCDKRGPKFWKLSKRVTYPIQEVLNFEAKALRESTGPQPCHDELTAGARLYSAREAADATDLPMYWFSHQQVREKKGIPAIRVGKSVRFNPNQLIAWVDQLKAAHTLARG